jgi:hypothetical protein
MIPANLQYLHFYQYNFQQDAGNNTAVVIHQAQEELYGYRPVFKMPVQIRFNLSNGSDTTITVWNDQQTQSFYFEMEESVSSVNIDPDKWILRKTQFKPDIPLAITEFSGGKDPEIYPNPFSGEVTIRTSNFTSETEVAVWDMYGRKITSLSGRKDNNGWVHTWDGNDSNGKQVKKGTYLIRITNGERQKVKTIVYMK